MSSSMEMPNERFVQEGFACATWTIHKESATTLTEIGCRCSGNDSVEYLPLLVIEFGDSAFRRDLLGIAVEGQGLAQSPVREFLLVEFLRQAFV